MNKLLAFAKTHAEELRAKADKEHLDNVDLQATEGMASELDEAARVLAVDEGAQLVVLPKHRACLPLTAGQVSIVDRALTCFAATLQAARDAAVISHETFCGKADRVRAVQRQVWDIAQRFEEIKRQKAGVAGGDPPAQD